MRVTLGLIAVLVTLTLAACAPSATPTPTPSPSPTPTPLSPDNIRQRIVQSLEREGKVTQFEIARREGKAQEPTRLITGWLDLAGERGRAEESGGSIVVMADGIQFALHAGRGSPMLLESVIGHVMDDSGVEVPPEIDNIALLVLNPLALPLGASEAWVAAGEGEWGGAPALVWEIEHPLGESAEVLSVVYVDPETALPLGQILRLAGDSIVPRSESRHSYKFTFVSNGDVPDRTFAPQELRERLLGYGEHEGEGPDYRLAWLGPDTKPGVGLPALTLEQSQVSAPGGIPFTRFTYNVVNPSPLPIDAQFGLVNITVRPTPPWDDWAVDRFPAWYEYLPREEVTVLGQPALFAFESVTRIRAIVLLDDITIEIEARGLHDSIPAERYEGGIAPSATYDRSAFNNAEAIRALLPLLTEVR